MNFKSLDPKTGCAQCVNGSALDFKFTMAFQPIVDLSTGTIFAQEALVRGLGGESAYQVLGRVDDSNRYRFDQSCRQCAIHLAARLGVTSAISINFLPNAVYQPEHCIRTTLAAAEACGFPLDRIIFEVTESEHADPSHLRAILQYYKRQGFMTAIDDFGAGYAGLSLLADFQPNFVKLDMGLIRNLDQDRPRRSIIKGILQVCCDLKVTPLAEGVETAEEVAVLRDFGVDLFQGFYFAKPAFEALADVPAHLLSSPRTPRRQTVSA